MATIRIEWPTGSLAYVSITRGGGGDASFTVDGEAVTFPYKLTASTTFETNGTGIHVISVKYRGMEIAATPDAPRIITLSENTRDVFAPSRDGATVGRDETLFATLSATYAQVQSVHATPYGDGTTDATAHIQSVIDAANAAGAGVYVPAGTYNVSAALENVQRLILAPGATIKATAAMGAVVRTSATTSLKDGGVVGKGAIDGNDLADYCLHPRYFVRFEANGLYLRGGKVGGIKLGDTATAGRSAEANLQNLHIDRPGPLTVPVGSQGIVVENSGDHTLASIIINGYETGVYLPAGGNVMARDVHVWTAPTVGNTKTGFDVRANNCHFHQCHADTPTEYGWRIYGYQTTLIQCGTYINPTAANSTDNIVVGVKFEGANSIATIVAHFFLGGSASKRLKADIEAADGNYGLITVIPLVGQHIVTARAFNGNYMGLQIADGKDVTVGTGTGSKIGSAATQKLAFWGATPRTQPQTSGVTAGHTPGTGAAVTADSTFTGNWGTTPYTLSDIISNLKQVGILKS